MLKSFQKLVESRSHAAVRGFTLVELMVALVVGLIVTLAAVSFVVSVAQANSLNIRVTRLTQELRSLSEVMAHEIRRARYVRDPISNVGQPGGVSINNTVATNPAGTCIKIAYDEPPPSTAPPVQASIYLNAGSGRVYIAPDIDCGSTAVGNAISTPEVKIDSLQFTKTGQFQVEQLIRGHLSSGASGTQSISRQFNQTIFVRSGQVI